MDSMWMLYWITRAINLREMAGGGFWMCLFGLAFLVAIRAMAISDGTEFSKFAVWGFGILTLILSSLTIFFGLSFLLMPTKQEAAVIVAGGAVVEAAKSETAQRLASKSVTILENSLDNILGTQAVEKAKREINGK
ncbi:hypothetical protein D3C87_278550 [compost metagenome]